MFVFEHYDNRKQTNQPMVNQIKTFMRDEPNNMMIVVTLKEGILSWNGTVLSSLSTLAKHRFYE